MVKWRYVYFTISDAGIVTLGDDEISEYYERNKSKYVDASGQPKPLADVKDELKQDLLDPSARAPRRRPRTALTVKARAPARRADSHFTKTATDAGLTAKETDFFDLRSPGQRCGCRPDVQSNGVFAGTGCAVGDPVHGKDGYTCWRTSTAG